MELCGWFLLASLVHELGHLLAMKLCGVRIEKIRLDACGAVIETGWMRYGTEWICAASGPLAGIALGLGALRGSPELAVISLGLSVFNLLPLYPMDGGRMLRDCLMHFCTEEHGEKILHWVTMGTCMVLMVLACWGAVVLQAGVWPIFAALVLLWRVGGQEKQLLFYGIEDKMKRPE